MSKIDKFLAHPVEVTIGGENYMLKPFTVDDLPLIQKMGSKNEDIAGKAIQKVIYRVLKQIDNDVTEEQASNVSIEYLEDIMNAVSKINGVDTTDAKQKLLEDAKS